MFRLPTAMIMLLCGLGNGSAVAAEVSRPVISPLATLGKLALALLFVLFVFWAFARLMRQLQGPRGNVHGDLSIVASLSLGQRERVVVVQAGESQLLLGVTASQVNTLHVLDSPLRGSGPGSGRGPEELGDFRQKLSAALKRQVSQ